MRWAGHLVRMDASKLAMRAEVEKYQGRSKRERPQLRWEYCVRSDIRKSGKDERWREGWPIENYGKKEKLKHHSFSSIALYCIVSNTRKRTGTLSTHSIQT